MATGVDAKLLKSTKFPPEFNQKVDMQKVNVQVMKKWIANRVTEILGNEDDVVIELIFNLVEGDRHPDVKSLQIQLTGFLDKDTPQGVPKELLEAKKQELMQEKPQFEPQQISTPLQPIGIDIFIPLLPVTQPHSAKTVEARQSERFPRRWETQRQSQDS
ncbi:hypothetical protein N0V88_006429 [Collariella sp. IMI 366227]|nr:hypothetical protein N0V88_006429 [Collariella sp. IMI 366227]